MGAAALAEEAEEALELEATLELEWRTSPPAKTVTDVTAGGVASTGAESATGAAEGESGAGLGFALGLGLGPGGAELAPEYVPSDTSAPETAAIADIALPSW